MDSGLLFSFFATLLPLPVIALLIAIALPYGLNEAWADLLAVIPVIAGAGAAVLAWRFRQGNISLAALVLLLVYALWEVMPPGLETLTALYQASALYLPLAFLFLFWIPERGLFNKHGVVRAFLVLMPGAAIYAYHSSGVMASAWMHHAILPGFVSEWSSIPHWGILALVAGVIGLGELHRRRRSPLEVGGVTALLLATGGLSDPEDRLSRDVFIAGAAIALVVVLVQNGYRVAFHDELTGLPGRRALRSLVAELGNRYAIAMADVDHFKKFNDTYGHDVGDQVLQRVAKVLGRVGGGGRAFRYGGEEFTIVFPGKRAAEAVFYLEQVRKTMADTPFYVRSLENPSDVEEKRKANKNPTQAAQTSELLEEAPKHVTITISIGVAEVGEQASTPEAVMKQADEALYRAKQKGRNQVSG